MKRTTQTNSLQSQNNDDTIYLPDVLIGTSVGAKARNYDVIGPDGKIYHFAEGTWIQDRQVFAGYGTKKPLHDDVAETLIKRYGGDPDKWQKAKGIGTLLDDKEERKAEVHWYYNPETGMVEHKVKEWRDES